MAKTAPLKNKNAPSKHSRAAKRASSPSINTDKSLKEVKPPTDLRHPVLAANTGSGVKKSKGRVLSSKARKRHEKGMDRAEAVMDRTEKKIEKSKGRARNIQDRSKAWEETNKKALAEKVAAAKKTKEEEENWEDEEVEETETPKLLLNAADDEVEMADVAEDTSAPTDYTTSAPVDSTTIPTTSVDTIGDVDLIL